MTQKRSMILDLQFTRLLLAAACAAHALAITALAQDQTTAAATERQIAQPAPRIVVAADGKRYRIEVRTHPITELMRFAEFIDDIGWEDLQFKAETEQGKNPIIGRRNYSQLMHIREDEEQDMRNIFLGAFYQGREYDKQSNEDADELHRHHSAEAEARLNERDRQRPKIYEEAIAQVKRQLGEETFKKVDEYVIRLEGKTRTETIVGPADPPSPNQPGNSPAAGKTPATRP